MLKESAFNWKLTAITLLLILLMFLLVACNDDNDQQADSPTWPQIIPVAEFYTPTPGAVASGPDLQATRAALRAAEIDQALQQIEANLTPVP